MKEERDRQSTPQSPNVQTPTERFRITEPLTPGSSAIANRVWHDNADGCMVDSPIQDEVVDLFDRIGQGGRKCGAEFGQNFGLPGETFKARKHPETGRYEIVGSQGLRRWGRVIQDIDYATSGPVNILHSPFAPDCTGFGSTVNVTACHPLGNQGDLKAGTLVLLHYHPELKVWRILPGTAATGGVQFKLLQDRPFTIAQGDCQIEFAFVQAKVEQIFGNIAVSGGLVPCESTVTVRFLDHLFMGAIKDARGIAVWDENTEEYIVVECQQKAGFILFETTSDRDPSELEDEVEIDLIRWWGTEHDTLEPPLPEPTEENQNPKLTVTFLEGMFPRALAGAIGMAVHDVDKDKYYVVICDQQALTLRSTLGEDLCPGDPSAAIDDYSVRTFYPFSQKPDISGNDLISNWLNLAANNGESALVAWDESIEDWVFDNLYHKGITNVEDVRLTKEFTATQECKILLEKKTRQIAVMYCDTNPSWSDAGEISATRKTVVTDVRASLDQTQPSGQDDGACSISIEHQEGEVWVLCDDANESWTTSGTIDFKASIAMQTIRQNGLCIEGYIVTHYVPCIEGGEWAQLICGVDCSESGSGSGAAGGGGSGTGQGECGTCTWQWNGSSWSLVSSNCGTFQGSPCACVPPTEDGVAVDQEETTDCAVF